MTDLSGGAVAPADAPSIPDGAIIADAALPPQPLGSQAPTEPAAPAKAEPKSLDDSIDRAFAKSAEKEAAKAAPEKVAPPKEAPIRADNGKFAPKEPILEAAKPAGEPKAPEPAKASFTASEAPSRFSPDAKERWAETHESVRGETERAIRELTDGHQKYRESAEKYEGYRELDSIAQQVGKKGADVFREYYQMEQHLQKDLVGGLDAICQKMGVSIKDVAAHVLNQPADQQASQSDATIRELKQEIATLKQGLGSVQQTFQQQQTRATQGEVEKFASDPQHSRFDELADDIAFFLSTRTKDLSEAYSMAERLNPALAQASNVQPLASSAAAPAPEAQNLKGQKSITGAPSPGLRSPGKPRTALSLDDALDRAFGSVG